MIFNKTDILIPKESIDMQKWSCIACDQHTSEPEYWDALKRYIGDTPSTLNMILPEAYLNSTDAPSPELLNANMQKYLDEGIFDIIKDSFIYLERTLPSGVIRRGLIGAIDLDEYDYSANSISRIRATEGTVEDRLPPRVAIRKAAPLELPHVMVFINDKVNMLIGSCRDFVKMNFDGIRKIYDFDLNSNGGHVSGYAFQGIAANAIEAEIKSLEDNSENIFLAVGDGNHSLATAKKCGDKYALVEIVNILDDSIVFEPIHRVIFDTDTTDFEKQFNSKIRKVFQGKNSYGQTVQNAEDFCREYIKAHGGKIDYIHNDETAIEMAKRSGCVTIMLPALNKQELFESIEHFGPYPKKSFSIGHADEKRFYLECRRINN